MTSPDARTPAEVPTDSVASPAGPSAKTHRALARAALLIWFPTVGCGLAMWVLPPAFPVFFTLFCVLAGVQLLLGLAAVVAKLLYRKRGGQEKDWAGFQGGLAMLVAPLTWVTGLLPLAGGLVGLGGAWGRPLRLKGRQRHPELREGADWTEGARPNPAGLDAGTRAALEALWLHDAQKEHASVPAFTRVSWLLAAVGAPAELLAACHRAAIEEIEHTQRCFALAAGYAGRSFTVEAMPELLLGGLSLSGDPLVTLAVESLNDGCQLEDFNADVAARCAAVCEEPVTREVLARIAREERSHAEFSWAVLTWALARDPQRVAPQVLRALETLDEVPRPTAVSREKAALVMAADPASLRRHGRLSDAEWGDAWTERLVRTRTRAQALLAALPTTGALRQAA